MFTWLFPGGSATPDKNGGEFTHIYANATGPVGRVVHIWADPNANFVYCAGQAGGLLSYSVDPVTGITTLVDTDDQGGSYFGVTGNDDWIITANQSLGIQTYTRDGSGNLTYVGNTDMGGAEYSNVDFTDKVMPITDFPILTVGHYFTGFETYQIDDSGVTTRLDLIGPGGGQIYRAWQEPGTDFVWCASGAAGMRLYTIDASGLITFVDNDLTNANTRDVIYDGDYAFGANVSVGMQVFSRDGAGNLTYEGVNAPALFNEVWWEEGFNVIYGAAVQTNGVVLFTRDDDGVLTVINQNGFQADDAQFSVHGNAEWLFTGRNVSPATLDTWKIGYMRPVIHLDNKDNGGQYLTGTSDGDGYVYTGNSSTGVHSYSVDTDGIMTFVETSADPHSYIRDMWWDPDRDFIYTGGNNGGIASHSHSNGALTKLDHHVSSSYDGMGIWSDANFVYCACNDTGLRVYTIDGGGVFTETDRHDIGGNYLKVCGDGNFIYVAAGAAGLLSYSVDGGGNLTYIDGHDLGSTYNSVWCANGIIYVGIYSSPGLVTYTADGSGNLTYTGEAIYSGSITNGVYAYERYVFNAADSHGLRIYTYSGETIQHVRQSDDVGEFYKVWGDGTFIYCAAGNSGIHSYKVED